MLGWWWQCLTTGVIINMGSQFCHTGLLVRHLLVFPTTLAKCVGAFVPSTCLLGITMEGRVKIRTCSSLRLVKHSCLWLSTTPNPLFLLDQTILVRLSIFWKGWNCWSWISITCCLSCLHKRNGVRYCLGLNTLSAKDVTADIQVCNPI